MRGHVQAVLHRAAAASARAAWFNSTRWFDIGKARRVLGYQPKIEPEEGLKEMVHSYQQAGWL